MGSGYQGKHQFTIRFAIFIMVAFALYASSMTIGIYASLALVPLIGVGLSLYQRKVHKATQARTEPLEQVDIGRLTVALEAKDRKGLVMGMAVLSFMWLLNAMTTDLNSAGAVTLVITITWLVALIAYCVYAVDLLSRRAQLFDDYLHVHDVFNGYRVVPLADIRNCTTRHTLASKWMSCGHGDIIEVTRSANICPDSDNVRSGNAGATITQVFRLHQSMPHLGLLVNELKKRAESNEQVQ